MSVVTEATTALSPQRYLANQSSKYKQLIEAANTYAEKFESKNEPWLYRKPLDPTPGNPYFYSALYNAMNLLRVMHLPPGGRVLEVGSGAGWLTEILLGLGFEVVALEPSEAMVRVARRRLALFAEHHNIPEPLKVEFRCESLEACGLLDESVDGVIFYEALHHVVDENLGLAQCFRVLSPGGVLGVTAEAAWWPGSPLEAAIDKEMAEYGTLENPYTQAYLDQILDEAGFKNITRYHGVNGFFPVAEGSRTLTEVADSPAGSSNHLTGRKSYAGPTTKSSGVRTLANMHIRTADFCPTSRHVFLSIELTNCGETVWLANEPSGIGYVTASIFQRVSGSSSQKEAGRLKIPRDVLPQETVIVEGLLPIDSGLSLDSWHVGLINEGYFWFDERGTPAIKLSLSEGVSHPPGSLLAISQKFS